MVQEILVRENKGELQAVDRQQAPGPWHLASELTRRWLRDPDPNSLLNVIGEQDFQHLLRIGDNLRRSKNGPVVGGTDENRRVQWLVECSMEAVSLVNGVGNGSPSGPPTPEAT